MTEHAKTRKPDSIWAVRATNDVTGEIWAIHDTREACEAALAAKLEEWPDIAEPRVEWAELGPVH